MRADVVVLSLALALLGCAGVETSAGRGGSRVLRQGSASFSETSRERRPGVELEDEELGEERHREPVRVPRGTVILGGRPGEVSRQALELGLLDVDAFEKLLVRAGLEDVDALPVRRNPFTPDDAVEVLGRLMERPVTLRTFPPRMAAGFLLREVLERGEVSREELVRRVARFAREQVAVLRPDGYLAWALDGSTQQKVAPVTWKDGAFRAGHFELGRFYSGRGGVFRHVDARLRASDWRPLAEVYDDADVINRSLDGAEDAFVGLYHALGQVLSRPTDSLAGLRHLPAGVVALIASSPEYWERFLLMTAGEQIREVAKLTTNVLVTWGAASATTRTVTGMMAGAEATVPVLSLSAEGALVLERIAVPVGRAAAVLSSGPGAVIVLQRANATTSGAAPSAGPGKWGPARESMSERARRYQEQVSGHSADEAYWVGDVKFDGFTDGVLLEAKGPGYANKFLDNLDPKSWFKDSGAVELVKQANRQISRVRGTGIPIEWHIAEKSVADAIRKLFQENKIKEIAVIHTPAR
ncbi:Tox-REase-5 domain-containing protein [Corallococcus sp. BB11-1]|uniref:Tox-REase-5 domain-containing protein n=1 Tax=Corallococcus sp. BB11-1 TaxID=2996783 RepID=UPI002D1E41BC|nr:Tox-REase-5 domain-containing protein [Corallococcus sp. BB11-1]